MTQRQKMLLKELPKNNNIVSKAAIKAGYTENTANSNIYTLIKKSKGLREYFNEDTVKKELRLALKKCKSKTDYTNVLRAIELMSKILGMQVDKTEITEIDKDSNQFSLNRLAGIKKEEPAQGVN